tara:strand:+ start:152 stop:397 length:246 start_codon:yes stop_codon:yes gene_type:complete
MKVTCINDKNQPQGAEVVKDKEYKVLEEFMNAAGQMVYLIEGISNKGTTKIGFPWYGYSADRFAKVVKEKIQAVEFDYALN